MLQAKHKLQDKMYFTNNERKMVGLPMYRKKNRKRRFYTRCEATETISEFIEYCNR